jgi:hypothetical protein
MRRPVDTGTFIARELDRLFLSLVEGPFEAFEAGFLEFERRTLKSLTRRLSSRRSNADVQPRARAALLEARAALLRLRAKSARRKLLLPGLDRRLGR